MTTALTTPRKPPRPDDFPAGLRFGEAGRYELRERIGQGGMAQVYKAVDTHLGNRLCAVKLLSSSTLTHATPDLLRELFIAEASALSRIRDNNVVHVITNGVLTDQNRTPSMVTDYLVGQDLSGLLKAEKQLAVERAVDIILDVSAGITACHLAGVIHRDLKPANIFLDETLRGVEAKVLDFSVAKIPISAEQTKTDVVVGTESYMAPEVANGRPANERSDQYSIGALLYQCLTGQVPRGFLSKPRESRPEIAEELDAALLRAMDPKPDQRFASVHDFGRTLLPFASPVGRAKWNHYYTTPPMPVRAAFSGPLSSVVVPATSAIGVTKVTSYDFVAHERTTHVDEPSTSSATIPDRAPPLVTRAPDGTGVSAVTVPPRLSRRSLVLAGAALLIVGVGAAALLGTRRAHEPAPEPPAWTRSAPPAATPLPPAPPAAPPPKAESEKLPPPTVLQAVPLNAPAEPALVADGATSEAKAQRPKKKRRKVPGERVRYTREGNPIVD